MSALLKFVTPVLALVIAAWFDIARDAPISAAMMATAAIIALVVRDAVEHAVLAYALVHQRELVPPDPNQPPVQTNYERYCERMVAQDWLDRQCDLLLDEYDQLPPCKEATCNRKRSQCTQHAYLNTQPVFNHDFDELPGTTLEA